MVTPLSYVAVTRGTARPVVYHARALTVEDAADHVARKLAGKRARAVRQTGTEGGSGIFTVYVPLKRGGGMLDGGLASVAEFCCGRE